MEKQTNIQSAVVNILFIYKEDQNWEYKFKKLNDFNDFKVIFKEEKTFDLSYLDQYLPDIIIIPLTLKAAMSLEIAKHIHLSKPSCKILLCSNTMVPKALLDKVFDLHIRRSPVSPRDMHTAIDELISKSVERINDDIVFKAFSDAILFNESWFGPENKHGGTSYADLVHRENSVKQSLRYYLLFVLITMVCSLYSVADTLYKQFVFIGPNSKDVTIISAFVIPFVWPFIYTYYHHNIGEALNRRERNIYVVSIALELILIGLLIYNH